MNWHDKSKDSDLYFCVNVECNVITFRPGPTVANLCPKCHQHGSIVRSQTVLTKGIRDAN